MAALFPSSFCSVLAACSRSLSQASVSISVKGQNLSALIDSGSSHSFIDERIIKKLKLCVHPLSQDISLALSMAKACVLGHCFADINLNDLSYIAMCLGVINFFCCDVILGMDFQKEHRSVNIKFGGSKPDLVIPNPILVCDLSEASLGKLSLLQNSSAANQSQLSWDVLARIIRPYTSRNYSHPGQKYHWA